MFPPGKLSHLRKTLTTSLMPLKIQCSSSKAKHKLSDLNHSALLYTSLFTSHGWIGSWGDLLALVKAGRSRTTLSCQAAQEIGHPERVLRPGNWSRGGHSCSRRLERIKGLAAGNPGGFFARFLNPSLGPRPSYYPRFPSAHFQPEVKFKADRGCIGEAGCSGAATVGLGESSCSPPRENLRALRDARGARPQTE